MRLRVARSRRRRHSWHVHSLLVSVDCGPPFSERGRCGRLRLAAAVAVELRLGLQVVRVHGRGGLNSRGPFLLVLILPGLPRLP